MGVGGLARKLHLLPRICGSTRITNSKPCQLLIHGLQLLKHHHIHLPLLVHEISHMLGHEILLGLIELGSVVVVGLSIAVLALVRKMGVLKEAAVPISLPLLLVLALVLVARRVVVAVRPKSVGPLPPSLPLIVATRVGAR